MALTRQEIHARHKERYYSDPEFRQKCLDSAKRYHAKKRKTDPEYSKSRSEYNKANAVYFAKKQKEYNKAQPFHYAFKRLRARAKKFNIEFNLSEEYLVSIWTGKCAIFGTELSLPYSTISQDPNKATIDKIIPKYGYIKGNVQWVCSKANTIKSFGSEEEHLAIVDYIRRYKDNILLEEYKKTNKIRTG